MGLFLSLLIKGFFFSFSEQKFCPFSMGIFTCEEREREYLQLQTLHTIFANKQVK